MVRAEPLTESNPSYIKILSNITRGSHVDKITEIYLQKIALRS